MLALMREIVCGQCNPSNAATNISVLKVVPQADQRGHVLLKGGRRRSHRRRDGCPMSPMEHLVLHASAEVFRSWDVT